MNLKQWREKQGLKMHEAAARFGISQPTISRIENGDHLPSSSTIAKLVKESGGAITGSDLFKAWEKSQRTSAA